jgi:site-specific DNA-methyltransferase (adenine-specific)
LSKGSTGVYARSSAGFMGQTWDGTGIELRPETWRACYDVLPPGGYLLAFGGTRTWHRIACAIEDAGFEIRDSLMWLYGTGFPKSHDVSKGIDKMLGAEREVVGVRAIPGYGKANVAHGQQQRASLSFDRVSDFPASPEAAAWAGWGTALKPGWEPIIMARKPLEGTVAQNVLRHGTGAINIDACRLENPDYDATAQQSNRVTWEGGKHSGFSADHSQAKYNAAGRWPANVLHDGSDEVEAAFAAFGSASRFFYSAKTSKAERGEGNNHPTVKPQALMRWLVRMVTPPGGTVLDPFAGSGSTGLAARAEGFDCVLAEQSLEYCRIIRNRAGETLHTALDRALEAMCFDL